MVITEKDYKKLEEKYHNALGKAGANGRYRDSLYKENQKLKETIKKLMEGEKECLTIS